MFFYSRWTGLKEKGSGEEVLHQATQEKMKMPFVAFGPLAHCLNPKLELPFGGGVVLVFFFFLKPTPGPVLPFLLPFTLLWTFPSPPFQTHPQTTPDLSGEIPTRFATVQRKGGQMRDRQIPEAHGRSGGS